MPLGKVSTKPVNVLNGRSGAHKVPYRDATAAVAAQIGRSHAPENGGIQRHTPPCGACGGRKK